ncbi:alcohol dehydrogenase catalytic domain-containing protein [Paracoccus kondratievae]
MSQRMKRWEMGQNGRDALELKEVPIPEPRAGEVLVKVAAVSLNYRDKLMIESGMGMPLEFPFTPGSDLAGTVVAVGEGVTRLAKGQRVISTFSPDWLDGTPPGNARTPSYRALGVPIPAFLPNISRFRRNGWFAHRKRCRMPRPAHCHARG